MVLQNHRPLRREIFTDEVVLPALSHHTPHLPQRTTPPRAQWHEGEWSFPLLQSYSISPKIGNVSIICLSTPS